MVYTVIMAGGSGTRFWPASRRALPKQFLPLGDGVTPLLTATIRRVAALSGPGEVIVVTRADLAEATRSAAPELPAANVLLEPVGRNTAPCVAWATETVLQRDPSAVLVVLAADAHIADESAFVAALRTAVKAAEGGAIVTLGIRPTRPETGYGYLHVGEAWPGGLAGVWTVNAFVEKPDEARAAAYVAGGQHLWNAGIFVFRADVMARAVAEHLPAVAEALRGADASTVQARYPGLPNVSIDYAVMEKVAAWELGDRDASNNAVRGARAVVVDATENVVVAPAGKTVALIGVHGLVVVDTGDALLVIPRERAQDVKRAVDALAAAGRDDVL